MTATPIQQFTKYQLKYSGANVTTVLTAIKSSVMEPRYEAAISQVTDAREVARKILNENGVEPGKWGIHIAFAMALASAKFSFAGPTLAKVAQALKARFVGLGADPTICDKLIEAIVGALVYY